MRSKGSLPCSLYLAVYPESFNSSSSAELDTLLTSKLREYGLELRELYAKYRGNSKDHDAAVEKCREVKDDQVSEPSLEGCRRNINFSLGDVVEGNLQDFGYH